MNDTSVLDALSSFLSMTEKGYRTLNALLRTNITIAAYGRERKRELMRIFTVVVLDEGGTRRYFSGVGLHRIGGPAIVCACHTEWWVEGRRHRKRGPAVEWSGKEEWYYDGVRHRANGPAVVWKGCGSKEWWYWGVRTKKEYAKK